MSYPKTLIASQTPAPKGVRQPNKDRVCILPARMNVFIRSGGRSGSPKQSLFRFPSPLGEGVRLCGRMRWELVGWVAILNRIQS
jgi:hypothetical protein